MGLPRGRALSPASESSRETRNVENEHGIIVSRKLTLPYNWWHRIPTPYKTVNGVNTFALF